MNEVPTFYVGDSVPLRFTVKDKKTREVLIPWALSVSVFSDEGEIIREENPAEENGIISYTIDPEHTKKSGNYNAIFDLRVGVNRKMSHSMRFVVLPRGLPSEAAGSPIVAVSPSAVQEVVEKAMADSIRKLRREMPLEVAVKVTHEVAQVKAKQTITKETHLELVEG